MKYIKAFEELDYNNIDSILTRYGVVKINDTLKYKNNVNKRYDDGNTLLMYAAKLKNYYLVKDLIESGADVNLQNNKGETALMMISSHFYNNSLEYRNRIIKELINAGAKLNLKDDNGDTALLKSYDYEVAKILIESGADLNVKNKKGYGIFDTFIDFYKNNIIRDFPEKYKKYLEIKKLEGDVDKYNL